MTDIIQTNIDDILRMFQRGAEVRSCDHLDLQGMNQCMSEELSMLDNGYDGVLLGGVINPFFRLLDTALILSAYITKYTSGVIQYSSQMDIEHIILVTQMSDRIDQISAEIKKLRTNLQNK